MINSEGKLSESETARATAAAAAKNARAPALRWIEEQRCASAYEVAMQTLFPADSIATKYEYTQHTDLIGKRKLASASQLCFH